MDSRTMKDVIVRYHLEAASFGEFTGGRPDQVTGGLPHEVANIPWE